MENIMTRAEQKELRKNQILMTALDLFIRKGYAATKITDIAGELKMSVGLLFHYFESKEKLLQVLVEIGLEGTRFPLEQPSQNPLEFFENFTDQLFTIMKEQPYTAKMFVLMAHAQRYEGIPEYIREIALQVNTIQETSKIVEAGQQSGTIRQGNPLALANCYWCSIQGIAENYTCHPEVPLPEPEWVVAMLKP
jgi:AcrR family transcriptional regulator